MQGVFQMQDLPLPWLSQFVATIREQETKLSMFGSCKLLRDVVLAQADEVQCLLDTSRVTTRQAARSLGLLAGCQEAATKRLVLQDTNTNSDALRADKAAEFSSWLATLCIKHSSVLEPITHVELKACCPNMTHFTRLGWFCETPNKAYMDSNPDPCPQLQHLTILTLRSPKGERSSFGPGEPECSQDMDYEDWGLVGGLSEKQMRRQFSALPNLQSLYCLLLPSACETHQDSDSEGCFRRAPGFLKRIIQPLCPRLQSLTVVDWGMFDLSGLCTNTWPQLQHLSLPGVYVCDEDMDRLLQQMPQIKKLEVEWLHVEDEWRERIRERMRGCTWQHLTVKTISCAALAMLPIPQINTLRIDQVRLWQEDWPHMQAATAILAGIPNLEVIEPPLELFTHDNFQVHDSRVPQLVALLQALRQDHSGFCCGGSGLQPRMLHALGQVPCRSLTVRVDAVPENCWGTLLQQLPSLQVLHVEPSHRHTRTSITWLATFCRLASRPCTLQLDVKMARSFGPGWHTEIMNAMHAAGHQHVRIEFVG